MVLKITSECCSRNKSSLHIADASDSDRVESYAVGYGYEHGDDGADDEQVQHRKTSIKVYRIFVLWILCKKIIQIAYNSYYKPNTCCAYIRKWALYVDYDKNRV